MLLTCKNRQRCDYTCFASDVVWNLWYLCVRWQQYYFCTAPSAWVASSDRNNIVTWINAYSQCTKSMSLVCSPLYPACRFQHDSRTNATEMKFGEVSPWPNETYVCWCMFFNNKPFRVHLASLQAERLTTGAFHPTSTSCRPGRTRTAASTSWERTDLRCVLGPAKCCAAERRTGRAGGGRASCGRASGTAPLPSATGAVAALNAAQCCGADGNVKAPWTWWIEILGCERWYDVKGRRTCWDRTMLDLSCSHAELSREVAVHLRPTSWWDAMPWLPQHWEPFMCCAKMTAGLVSW